MSKPHTRLEYQSNAEINEPYLNSRGSISGWILVTIGIFLFISSLILLIFAAAIESIVLILLSLFTGTIVAGFFVIYPLVRLLFMGKDGLLPVLLTAYVEGVITNKVVKHARKNKQR